MSKRTQSINHLFFCWRCDSLACRNRILIFRKKKELCEHVCTMFEAKYLFGLDGPHVSFITLVLEWPTFGTSCLSTMISLSQAMRFFKSEVFFFRSVGKSDSRVPKQACDRLSRRIIFFHVAPRLFRIFECFHSFQGLDVFSVCVCVCLCVSVFVCDVWFSCVFGYLFIYMSLFVSVPQVAGAEGLLEQGRPAGGRGEWLGCWEGGWGQVGDGWWWQRA